MIAILALALLFCTQTAFAAVDCDEVDCEEFKFDVHANDNGFQECRFKMRNDNTNLDDKFGSGIQLHRFVDITEPYSEGPKPTQDCPAGRQLRLTESPRNSDDESIYVGTEAYKRCCVPSVVNFCYYKVVAHFHCHKWSPDSAHPTNDREDDVLQRVHVFYKNRSSKSTVDVVFHPIYNKVTCVGSADPTKMKVLYRNDICNVSKKTCGDASINVVIQRYKSKYANNYEYCILKTHRYQCNSQYVAMFTDPSGREKVTMRTVVDPQIRGDTIDGTQIGPVLAATYSGACGIIAKGVTTIDQ